MVSRAVFIASPLEISAGAGTVLVPPERPGEMGFTFDPGFTFGAFAQTDG